MSKSNSEMHNSETLKLIECPVCLEVILPPVFQCNNGHLVCSGCLDKILQCPTCRINMPSPPIRSLMVEKLTEHLVTKPCPNLQFGCQIRFTPNEEATHILKCEYSSKDYCRLLGIECSEFIRKRDIPKHMREYHMFTVLESDEAIIQQELESEMKTLPRKWLPVTFSFFNEHFFVDCELTTESNGSSKVSWRCITAGTSKLSKTFSAIFNLFNNKKHLVMTWQSCVLSTENIDGSGYFSVPLNTLEEFADGLNPLMWNIKVTIKKSPPADIAVSNVKQINMISISNSNENYSQSKTLPPKQNFMQDRSFTARSGPVKLTPKADVPLPHALLMIYERCVDAILAKKIPTAVAAFNLIDKSKQDDVFTLIVKRVYGSNNGDFKAAIDFVHKCNGRIALGLKILIETLNANDRVYWHSEIFTVASLAKQTNSNTVQPLLPKTIKNLFWSQTVCIELSCCQMRLDSDSDGSAYLSKRNEDDYQKWAIMPIHSLDVDNDYFMLKCRKTFRILKDTNGYIETVSPYAATQPNTIHWKIILTKRDNFECVHFQNRHTNLYLHEVGGQCAEHFEITGKKHMGCPWLITAVV